MVVGSDAHSSRHSRQYGNRGARFMPITPYLAHQAFEPETIQTMSAAFVAACDALHLKVGDDPATRLVAEKVINLAQRGIRDPDMLRTMTLKEFDLSNESGPL